MSEEETAAEGFGWASGFIAGTADAELSPVRIEKRRVAGAVRRVIEALVAFDAEADVLAEVANELEAAAEALESGPGAEASG